MVEPHAVVAALRAASTDRSRRQAMGSGEPSSVAHAEKGATDIDGARLRSDAPAVPSIVGATLQRRNHAVLAVEAVLDKLNRGVVIFDGEAQVRFVNDAALRMFRETSALAVTEGRLCFGDAGTQARLDAFLLRCCELTDGGTGQGSVVMRVETGGERAPLRVLLSPLAAPFDPAASRRDHQHVLMIYEPHAGRQLPKRILQELYGLSDAEADLVIRLFEGESLEVASGRLHISVNTAKTHLQHVFRKCDVHSQGELLQLLSLGPRTL
jgi:DNA-binding CsgD family transcriptional regulator